MFNSSEKRVEVSCPLEEAVERQPDQHMIMFEGKPYLRPTHMWMQVKKIMLAEGGERNVGCGSGGGSGAEDPGISGRTCASRRRIVAPGPTTSHTENPTMIEPRVFLRGVQFSLACPLMSRVWQ